MSGSVVFSLDLPVSFFFHFGLQMQDCFRLGKQFYWLDRIHLFVQ